MNPAVASSTAVSVFVGGGVVAGLIGLASSGVIASVPGAFSMTSLGLEQVRFSRFSSSSPCFVFCASNLTFPDLNTFKRWSHPSRTEKETAERNSYHFRYFINTHKEQLYTS